MKKIRNAVRVFCIKDEQILCIKYTNSKNNGYYDLPGGKIEKNETIFDTAIREVKEETGITIENLSSKGILKVEYEDMIFIFNIVFASKFSGNLEFNEDNESSWIKIDKLINKNNKMSIIKLLDENFMLEMKNNNISYIFNCNNKHEILKIEKGEK